MLPSPILSPVKCSISAVLLCCSYRTGSGPSCRARCLPRGGPVVTQIDIRPFHRRDREQLTSLVNAHAAAVVPGLSISVAAVMSDLEHQPDEFIIGPWV